MGCGSDDKDGACGPGEGGLHARGHLRAAPGERRRLDAGHLAAQALERQQEDEEGLQRPTLSPVRPSGLSSRAMGGGGYGRTLQSNLTFTLQSIRGNRGVDV